MKDNEEEKLPVVDEQGQTIGSANRRECHGGTMLIHPVVHLHVLDRDGRLYLQKRPQWKDIQPGRWDTAVGGHVDYGETTLQALEREVQEELGLTGVDFHPLTSYLFTSKREREFVHAYWTVTEKSPRPSEELDGGRFWTEEEIKTRLGCEVFTPNFESEYQRYVQPLMGERKNK